MARGFGKCEQCGGSTADISEEQQEAGKEVVYKCDMCGWEVKVFEDD